MQRLYIILFLLLFALPQAHGAKPVKVFILAGQSNMEGHGQLQSLPHLGKHPEYSHLLKKLQTEDGAWAVREDVTIAWSYKRAKSGPLTVGWGCKSTEIGPELMFGTIMGEKYDEHVLLIKTAWGNKDMYCDFRSPSAGDPSPAVQEMLKHEYNTLRKTGNCYRAMVEDIRYCLDKIDEIIPGYEGQGYEMAGVAWLQGWNDFCQWSAVPQIIDNYSSTLKAMIKDLRKDLDEPDLPFVIGELGVGGMKIAERAEKDNNDEEATYMMKFRASQKSVAEDGELKHVVFVPTAQYWDDRLQELTKQSETYWDVKRKQGIKNNESNHLPTEKLNEEFLSRGNHWYCHYNGSATTYSLIGYAMAEAMKSVRKD